MAYEFVNIVEHMRKTHGETTERLAKRIEGEMSARAAVEKWRAAKMRVRCKLKTCALEH